MNNSKFVNDLETLYCHNRSAVTSAGLSCGSASLPTRIINGGKRVLYTAAMTGMLLNNMTPYAYADLTVSAGQTSTGLTVGRAASNVVVSNLYNYGTTISTVVNSGGTENIYSGGIASGAIVNYSGKQYLSNGGSAINTIVNSGGRQYISSGGTASDTTLSSQGFQYVSSDGSAINTVVNSGGRQNVSSGGSSINVVQNSGGIINATVANNGTYITGINQNGEVFSLISGVASNFVLNSGSYMDVSSGGVASNTILNGGAQYVYSGGSATDTIVAGRQEIYSGGRVNGTVVLSGGTIEADEQIIATNIVQSSGGNINVWITDDETYVSGINQNGETMTLISGIASNFIINKEGQQLVEAGYSAVDTTVNNGGLQHVYAGGSSINVVQNSGGRIGALVANNGTYITGTNQNGETMNLISGVASNFVINDYGGGAMCDVQSVYSGGSAVDTILSGGRQWVSSGGTAIGTVIDNGGGLNRGGMQFISKGGIANDTTINDGQQVVYASGSVNSTTINAGGRQNISGGTANNTTVNEGGLQNVASGGIANDTVNNGTVNLYANGVLNDYSGNGNLNVYSANTISGTTDLGSGTMLFANAVPTTVTIENLSANNAVISMGVNLEDQTSDQLQVTSSLNGTAKLALRNTATIPTQTTGTGIKLVDIDNSATGTGTFELLGGKMDEGAYVYKLYQDSGDPDYYLRSTGEYSNTMKTMANLPAVNAMIAKTGMNSLNKRMGDLRDMNNPANKQGIWVRTYYKNATVDDLAKTDVSLFGVEAGYDWLFNAEEPNKLFAGVMVGYMRTDSMKTKYSDGSQNDGKGDAPSVGIYATMLNENGWFIDFAARNFWSKLENTTVTASNTVLKFDNNRNMLTGSLEAGKTFTNDKGFKVEPKVELSYMNVAKETNRIAGVGNLEYAAENYITGKAAVMFAYKAEMKNKMLIEPLLELAYNREFNGKGKVKYAGADLETSMKGGSFEVSTGLSMKLGNDIYWHALGTYEKSNKISSWGLNAGIRLGFGGDKK